MILFGVIEAKEHSIFTYCKLIRFALALLVATSLANPLSVLGRELQAPNAETKQKSPDFSGMTIVDLKKFANEKYWSDDYINARAAIEAILDRTKCSIKQLEHECLEIYMNLAVCQMQQDELQNAKKLLIGLLRSAKAETANNNNGGMDEPDCLFFLAECNYRLGSYKQAESLYREALAKYRKILDPLNNDLSPCLDGLAGCLCHKNDYADALPLFIELAKIDIKNRGPNDLTTAWSLMKLSDILKQLDKKSEAQPLFEKSVYTFRQTNIDRILAEHGFSKQENTSGDLLKKKLRGYIFGKGDRADLASGGAPFKELTKGIDYAEISQPRPYDFYNWRLKRTRIVDAPGLVTVNPNKPLQGLIICVHGLGLHHGTYKPFAQQMSERGFAVVAFDMRGFGAYKGSKGYDRIDLDSCVQDVADILKLMRRDYSNATIFLLGESMGGAIALRVASKYTNLIDGLICAVPSGSRFGATKTSISVALKFLIHKDKPFDIGKNIVAQATQAESLRQKWQNDPEARMMLSPKELLQFQRFMNQNLKAAEQLKNLPVIIFQGYGDKLVKPEGTIALYNALPTEDKDLVVVGHSEHLIFEEGQFKPALIGGLTGWLSNHLRNSAQ